MQSQSSDGGGGGGEGDDSASNHFGDGYPVFGDDSVLGVGWRGGPGEPDGRGADGRKDHVLRGTTRS